MHNLFLPLKGKIGSNCFCIDYKLFFIIDNKIIEVHKLIFMKSLIKAETCLDKELN